MVQHSNITATLSPKHSHNVHNGHHTHSLSTMLTLNPYKRTLDTHVKIIKHPFNSKAITNLSIKMSTMIQPPPCSSCVFFVQELLCIVSYCSTKQLHSMKLFYTHGSHLGSTWRKMLSSIKTLIY